MTELSAMTDVQSAVFRACVWEASARKVGNVHPGADFANLTFIDFLIAAAAIREPMGLAVLSRRGRRSPDQPGLGQLIRDAVANSRKETSSNVNLGIVLLLTPLAAVHFHEPGIDARSDVKLVLEELTVDDTIFIYEAIRLAQPGGMGSASRQDIDAVPTVTPLQAMALAAERDLNARQYVTGFTDIFEFGVPTLVEGVERFGTVEAAIVDSQLRWLAQFPDSLIVRKNGAAIAEGIRLRAAQVIELGGLATRAGRLAGIEFDRFLRTDGNRLNPGTTADLIAASLFVALRTSKLSPNAPFRWPELPWL